MTTSTPLNLMPSAARRKAAAVLPAAPDERPAFAPVDATPAPPEPLPWFSAAELEGQSVPVREWLAHDLIPMGTVTLLSGDGGTGKSLLALQLAAAVASGRPWLGRPVQEGSAIYMSAEDDKDELHRRLDNIRRETCATWPALGGLTLLSRAGEDALLAFEEATSLKPTGLFAEIDKRARDEKPALIVLDTLADVYPANENDRAKVRQFVGLLRKLAIRHRCAVLLLAHPSLSGLKDGSGMSGSAQPAGPALPCSAWLDPHRMKPRRRGSGRMLRAPGLRSGRCPDTPDASATHRAAAISDQR